MAYLLFPGRHVAHTKFQESYLRRLVYPVPGEKPVEMLGPSIENLDTIVFAITSSNQQDSKFNPIPFTERAIGVDRFRRDLEEILPSSMGYHMVGIPHFDHSDRFAHQVIEEVAAATEGGLKLTPENTVVLSSTPEMIAMYRKLGFTVAPAEWNPSTQGYDAPTPKMIIDRLIQVGDAWEADTFLREHVSDATRSLWCDFPQIPRRVLRIFKDPLLTDAGGLTDTRDYDTYTLGMGKGAVMDLKYADVRPHIVPGRIVDEGCSDGSLLVRIAKDFPDADLYGIEIAKEFLARCRERQRAGHFSGSYVHFAQRNLLDRLFEPESVDTVICNSTIHELWSYNDGEATVRQYLKHKFEQLKRGGRLIIRDVVGPEDKEQEVYVLCDQFDGDPVGNNFTDFANDRAKLARHLDSLSTLEKFERFAKDFSASVKRPAAKIHWEYGSTPDDDRVFVKCRLKDAVEFAGHKKYTDNWQSECHEEFAALSFSELKGLVRGAGFTVMENPNHPELGSRAYVNPYIVEHHYKGVQLFRNDCGVLVPLAFPETNMVVVGEKR